jgi:hypothetical protein
MQHHSIVNPPAKCVKLSLVPKFTIKELLIGTSLIASGIAMTCFTFRWLNVVKSTTAPPPMFAQLACWFLGPALLGAGILYPFKRPGLGAVAGMLIQASVIYVIYLLH